MIYTHTITADVDFEALTVTLRNAGDLPQVTKHQIMQRACWHADSTRTISVEPFPVSRGPGWATYKFRVVKDLNLVVRDFSKKGKKK